MKPGWIVLVGLSLPALAFCRPGAGEAPPTPSESQVPDTSIIAAQEALTEEVMRLPGVVGTAVGLCADHPCIKVFLAGPSPELAERIPRTYRGFQVDVEVSGEIRARDDSLP